MAIDAELDAWRVELLDPLLEKFESSCWTRLTVRMFLLPGRLQIEALEHFVQEGVHSCPLWHPRASVADLILHLQMVLPKRYLRRLQDLLVLLRECEVRGHLVLPRSYATHRVDVARVRGASPGDRIRYAGPTPARAGSASRTA